MTVAFVPSTPIAVSGACPVRERCCGVGRARSSPASPLSHRRRPTPCSALRCPALPSPPSAGNGLGVLYGINVSAPNPAATAKPVHYISGSGTGSCVFAQLAFTGGTRFVVTVLGLSVVQLVDTSDP